ncbi:MAG: TonB-dependent receptor [Sphingobium sp.]
MRFLRRGAFALGLVASSPALAQDGNVLSKEQPAPSEQPNIVVTGSLIRGLPNEYIASPVFTYDKKHVVRSGSNSISEYILTIPQNFAADLSDFGTSATSIGTSLSTATAYNQYDGFSAFALRGLASDATLTLLNGRRMPSVGMVEASTVSVIPSALIERIDIISDGASATYGADAVAGVVNIVTRKATDGVELRARGGMMTRTGAKSWDASALAATSWDTGSIYGMASYQRRDEFVVDPVISGTTPLQISQLPQEDLSGFYAGIRQEAGDIVFSVDASRFQRDRYARIYYPNTPQSNRDYRGRTTGWSINGNMHWDGENETAVDFNVDYGETKSDSETAYGPSYTAAYNHKNSLFVAEATAQTALTTLPAGPLILAGGAQYRVETLRTDAAIFFHKAGGRRRASSVFGEVNIPLVSPDMAVPLVRRLTVSAAARYEDLEFDSALAPKFGMRWQVDRSIAFRGTYARSFLVPRFRDTIGIAEQVSFWSQPYPFLPAGAQNPGLPAGNALAIYRAGANPGLRTQKADTFTIGTDFTPAFLPGLTLKAGYYRITIKGRVVTPSQTDAATLPDLQGFNILGPSASQVNAIVNNPTTFRWFSANVPFVNGGSPQIYNAVNEIPQALLSQAQVVIDIRPQNFAVEFTDGLDLDLSYQTAMFGGAARFQVTGQYILNLNLQAGSGASVSRLDGYAQASNLRLNGSAVWGRGGFSLGGVVNYIDGFTDNRANVTPEKVGSYTTTSMFLGFDLGNLSRSPALAGADIQFVVANVFDQRPPKIRNGYLGFDPYNNPPNPRTVSLVLTKRFGGK